MTDDINGSTDRAFLAVDAVGVELPLPAGHTRSTAYAINDDGIAVGFSRVSDSEAVRWLPDGTVEILELPFGPNRVANDINAKGVVCGYMGTAPFFSETHGFIWNPATKQVIDILPPKGAIGIDPCGINNKGQICGIAHYPRPSGSGTIRRAFLWFDEDFTFLEPLDGDLMSYALDLNDNGTVVGYSQEDHYGKSTACVWEMESTPRALETMVELQSGERLGAPWGVNNAGQIGGTATITVSSTISPAFLLTPVMPRTGDVNCDDIVNIDDLLAVINAWGKFSGNGGSGSPDLNDDGFVNVDDLLIIINNWTS